MLKSNWKKLEAKLVFVFHWPLNSENRIFFFLIPNLMELMMVIGDENKILSRITFLLRATGRDSLSLFYLHLHYSAIAQKDWNKSWKNRK